MTTFDLRRLGVEIAHCRVQALVPHDFLDQSRIPRLCHCHRTKCVAGAVQLQGIWDSELSSKLSERVLDPAQSDVTDFLEGKTQPSVCPDCSS